MPQNKTIQVVESGTRWPSGRSKPLAQLEVDDAWVIRVSGSTLASGVEDGLGPWVGIGGKLPSGVWIELLRHDLSGPLYALDVDYDADPREALAEFLAATGLDQNA